MEGSKRDTKKKLRALAAAHGFPVRGMAPWELMWRLQSAGIEIPGNLSHIQTSPPPDRRWSPYKAQQRAALEQQRLSPRCAVSSEPSNGQIREFYDSWEWKRLSYETRKERGQRCECCGATPEHGVRIVADHVKPIRRFWHLRLDRSNVQVLCDDCNRGKGSHDETDWRVRA